MAARWSTHRRGPASLAVYRRRADGVGGEDTLWSGTDHVHVEAATPDGRAIVMSSARVAGGQMDLVLLPLDGDRTLKPLLQTRFSEYGARLSPDGRLLAYTSDESGRAEVYLRSFPSLEGKTQVSTGGGQQPVWSRRGGELYFVGPGALMAVTVQGGPAMSVGPARQLFANRYYK
jgi:serine/threonine-protein kinase